MYRVENLAEMYRIVGKDLLDNGVEIKPRGLLCKEIIAPVIHIENPRGRLAYQKDRKFNIMYALTESLMLFQRTKELKYFSEFNRNIKDFSDYGEILYGAYGWRIACEIKNIILKLKEDSDTRQAVLTIYNNDCAVKTKDVPCTLDLHFLIRDKKLNLIVYMRSNDIMWGTSYDVFMFTMLQEVIANELGIELGWYKHIPSSLHVYEKHYDLLAGMWDCVNIEFANTFDFHEYRKISNAYVDFCDYVLKDYNFANNDMQKYMNMIFNEKMYRDPLFSQNYSLDISKDIPAWAVLFTKRWYDKEIK